MVEAEVTEAMKLKILIDKSKVRTRKNDRAWRTVDIDRMVEMACN